MKSLRIPLLLLSSLFALVLLNSLFINDRCQSWAAEANAIDTLAAQEDWNTSEKKLSVLYQHWQDAQLYLHITAHQATLDAIEEQFRCCAMQLSQHDLSQLRTSLTSLAAQLQSLGETEQLHPRNIF